MVRLVTTTRVLSSTRPPEPARLSPPCPYYSFVPHEVAAVGIAYFVGLLCLLALLGIFDFCLPNLQHTGATLS